LRCAIRERRQQWFRRGDRNDPDCRLAGAATEASGVSWAIESPPVRF
jgi:hypothetical protein